jgi:hypothetical protein
MTSAYFGEDSPGFPSQIFATATPQVFICGEVFLKTNSILIALQLVDMAEAGGGHE